MQKRVLITVNTTTGDPSGENNMMNFITEGVLSKEENDFIISYEESELTGLDGTTTTFRVGKDSVILARHGSVDSLMLFEVGKTHQTNYDTSYGSITLGVTAKNLDVEFNESGGNIKVDYILEYNRAYGGESKIYVNVRESYN